MCVAPYVGAWIETYLCHTPANVLTSHPTWVRGLKPMDYCVRGEPTLSHPTWVRGLKQVKKSNAKRHRRRTLRGCVD